MYVATASPRPKRSAFDSSRGGNVPCVPPPWIRHCNMCLLSWRTVGTPYVGMAPKKNGGHIKSAQMTRSKCLR